MQQDVTLPEILGYLMQQRNSGSLYAHILASLAYEETEHIPFMGVRPSGRGYTLMVNPKWLKEAEFPFVVTVIQHEALHIILQHIPRLIRKQLMYAGTPDEELFKSVHNIGSDMSVNGLLIEHDAYLKEHPDKAVLPGQEPWKYPPNLSFEDYADLLMDWARNQKEQMDKFLKDVNDKIKDAMGGSGDGSSPSGRAPELSGAGHPWMSGLDNMTPEEQASLAQDLADQAVETVKTAVSDATSGDSSKLRGLVPGGVCQIIETLLAPPTIPWQRVLRSMVVNTRRFKYRRSIRRPHRRHVGIPGLPLFPSKAKDMSFTIGFIVDTSGSMGTKELQEAIVELQGLQKVDKDVEIYVIESDAGVQDCYTIHANDKLEPEFRGRGGTTFDPALLHAREKQLDIVFYYTDGYAPAPEASSRVAVPFAWLITKGGVVPDKNWGKVIQLEN